MKLGFIRVESSESEVAIANTEPCLHKVDRLFVAEVGKSVRDGDVFRNLLEASHPGDCVVVRALNDLANSMLELRLVLKDLERRGLKLTSYLDGLDDILPSQIFSAFNAITNFQQQSKSSSRFPGLAAAKSGGRPVGRKPVLTAEKKRILDRLLDESSDIRQHAKAIGVSVRTVRRYISGEY